MFSTLRSLRRVPTTCSSFSSSASGHPWLSAPGNPLMCWPSSEEKSQSSVNPSPAPETSVEELSVAAISSLVRSTPLSDLKSALLHHLPTSASFYSIIDHLIRSHDFDLAWSLLLSNPVPPPLSTFASLFRRYSRARMPSSAIRAFLFLRRRPDLLTASSDDALELLLDALCKEGHPKPASDFFTQLRSEDPGWIPSIRCYNILLAGWFRCRNLKKAEDLWLEMRRDGISPTVVSYGTAIEGLCALRRPDQAVALLEEMRSSGIDPNALTCNPIVDSLSESGRFRDALGFVERFPVFGISPNLSTYNSLIKGFCKNGDLKRASDVLRTMIKRSILPTTTTYNYFFRVFARFGNVEEGMNLYTKMVESGYAPDRLTYQLLIKMLCEKERLDLAIQLMKEINRNGFELDLAMSTMLVHLLCRLRRYEEACKVFEEMFGRGIVPQYMTYHRLSKELKRVGLEKLEERVSDLINSVSHSTKLPATYRDCDGDEGTERQKVILKKAETMLETLKERKQKNHRVAKLKTFEESMVEEAEKLMKKFRRLYGVKS